MICRWLREKCDIYVELQRSGIVFHSLVKLYLESISFRANLERIIFWLISGHGCWCRAVQIWGAYIWGAYIWGAEHVFKRCSSTLEGCVIFSINCLDPRHIYFKSWTAPKQGKSSSPTSLSRKSAKHQILEDPRLAGGLIEHRHTTYFFEAPNSSTHNKEKKHTFNFLRELGAAFHMLYFLDLIDSTQSRQEFLP